MTPGEVEVYLQMADVKTAKASFRRFVRFLMETGRIEYGQTEELRRQCRDHPEQEENPHVSYQRVRSLVTQWAVSRLKNATVLNRRARSSINLIAEPVNHFCGWQARSVSSSPLICH
jgi:hypothetical protein